MPRQHSKPKLIYKIQKRFLLNPEKLADLLELLMVEHSKRANRAFQNEDGTYKRVQTENDKTYHAMNEGTAEGLNKAWKLIFGFESYKILKDT